MFEVEMFARRSIFQSLNAVKDGKRESRTTMSSVIDSRTPNPNHLRNVQGTAIYDVVPVDSRVPPALTPSFTVTSCANASGGQTTYTGTFTPAALPVNSVAEVSGFVNAPNNGSFQIVSVNPTTLVLRNAAGVAETHAATVAPSYPVDSRVAPNIPVDSRIAPNIPQNSRV
jgi:hypothetical protein